VLITSAGARTTVLQLYICPFPSSQCLAAEPFRKPPNVFFRPALPAAPPRKYLSLFSPVSLFPNFRLTYFFLLDRFLSPSVFKLAGRSRCAFFLILLRRSLKSYFCPQPTPFFVAVHTNVLRPFLTWGMRFLLPISSPIFARCCYRCRWARPPSSFLRFYEVHDRSFNCSPFRLCIISKPLMTLPPISCVIDSPAVFSSSNPLLSSQYQRDPSSGRLGLSARLFGTRFFDFLPNLWSPPDSICLNSIFSHQVERATRSPPALHGRGISPDPPTL